MSVLDDVSACEEAMGRFLLSLMIVVCASVPGLLADTVLLRTGETVEGRILGGTGNTVHIRRTGSLGVEVIDRANILRIHRGERTSPAESPIGGESAAEPSAPAVTPNSSPDDGQSAATRPADLAPQTIRELVIAIAKWRSEDFAGAGMDLARLINSADARQRQAMSLLVEEFTRRSLAELAADAHLRAALAARRGPAIRLSYVTEYEKPVLIRRLAELYEVALRDRGKESTHLDQSPPMPAGDELGRSANRSDSPATRPWYASSRPAASQPESRSPVYSSASGIFQTSFAPIDWLERPEGFDGSARQAENLAPRVHHAISLLNERIRLDPGLRRNAALKRRLLQDRSRLLTLSKALSEWDDRSKAPPPDPAAVQAEQARREYYQQQMLALQKEEMKRIQEAREAARKWQEEQEAAGRGWFDWLKPGKRTQPIQKVEPSPPADDQPPSTE